MSDESSMVLFSKGEYNELLRQVSITITITTATKTTQPQAFAGKRRTKMLTKKGKNNCCSCCHIKAEQDCNKADTRGIYSMPG